MDEYIVYGPWQACRPILARIHEVASFRLNTGGTGYEEPLVVPLPSANVPVNGVFRDWTMALSNITKDGGMQLTTLMADGVGFPKPLTGGGITIPEYGQLWPLTG